MVDYFAYCYNVSGIDVLEQNEENHETYHKYLVQDNMIAHWFLNERENLKLRGRYVRQQHTLTPNRRNAGPLKTLTKMCP